jgi:hypothetical protein
LVTIEFQTTLSRQFALPVCLEGRGLADAGETLEDIAPRAGDAEGHTGNGAGRFQTSSR